MVQDSELARLADSHSIELLVGALLQEGYSINDIMLAIVRDVPADPDGVSAIFASLDTMNEVLETVAEAQASEELLLMALPS